MEIPKFKSCLLAILLVAGLLFTTTKSASADTYQIFLLTSEGDAQFYGMDDFGNVAFSLIGYDPFAPLFCQMNTCYETFHDGTRTGFEVQTSGLEVNDSGTPCTPLAPPGGHVFRGVCNNGRDAFTGMLTPTQHTDDVYVGSYPDITQVADGGEGLIFMNARGDIVYDDAFSEYWYFLLDETTSTIPEPGSILLLATGAAAAILAMRRRSRALAA